MPKIKVKGQTVQTGERPQTKRMDTHTQAHTRTLPNVFYSTVALVPPMSTMDVWRGIT